MGVITRRKQRSPPSVHQPMDTPSTAPSTPSTSYVALSTQTGGHPGILTTEDGSLLIKPALPREVAFYSALSSEPSLQPLNEFVPKFLGTLRLEGQVDVDNAPRGKDRDTAGSGSVKAIDDLKEALGAVGKDE